MKDEIANLAADLRAALQHELLRGVSDEPIQAAVATPLGPVAGAAPQRPTPPPPRPAPPAPAAPVDAPVARAAQWSQLAQAARAPVDRGEETLHQVREALGDCKRCPLAAERTHLVFGVGDPKADLLIVGEAPGFHEDQTGEPFVGEAGQMLDRMLLGVLGLQRDEVYICNVVKCRPPGNRDPAPPEVAACSPYLQRQIHAVNPKLILVVGRVAMEALLGVTGIKKNRGSWHTWERYPVLPTFHPAYLLRAPEEKRFVFDDLKALSKRYDALGGRRPRPAPFP